jgi:hypothetical protein
LKEPAYQTIAPIQSPKITNDVYNKLMKAPLVTLSPEELFAISPKVRNRLHEAITPKRVPHETVLTNAYIEQASEEEAPIMVPDVYETYLNNLAPGDLPPLALYRISPRNSFKLLSNALTSLLILILASHIRLYKKSLTFDSIHHSNSCLLHHHLSLRH